MQEYIKTDQLLHVLSQSIAKMNRHFLPKKEDDSHTNLYFDTLQRALIGQWMKTEIGPVLFRLNLNSWSFEFVNTQFKILLGLDLQITKLHHIEESLIDSLLTLGIKPAGFRESMHYQIPNYELEDDCLQKVHPSDIEQWMTFRSAANNACYQILGSFQKKGAVRIWPHHFDTGIFIQASDRLNLGFGLAMSDHYCEQAYFYANAYTLEGKSIAIDKHEHPLEAGIWLNSPDFKGAILSLKEVKFSKEDILRKYIRSFLKTYLSLG
jgi:hypothetical protein